VILALSCGTCPAKSLPACVTCRIVTRIRTVPYTHVFCRALLQAGVRTAFIKQLAMGGGVSILLAVILSEGLMSWFTSSAVGLRTRKDHLEHFDAVWAVGAMIGVLASLLAMHLVYCTTGHEHMIGHCLISVAHPAESVSAATP
jgi:hypothetical protein